MSTGKVLVLGANGFIGSHVVDALAANGIRVRAFARPKAGENSKYKSNELIEAFSGDFFNQDDLKEALKGVTHVVHAISATNPATADNDPFIDLELNVRSSVELIQRCVEAGTVERFIFLSSGGTIYGEDDLGRPFVEDDPTRPFSPYAIGKLTIENYLRYFKHRSGLEYTVLRVANPYGPRQAFWKHQGVISVFLQRIIKGEPITVLGDGSMVRDYVYVSDVAEMISRIVSGSPRYEIYNIGSGRGTSINALIGHIETITGKEADISYMEAPSSFVHTSILDAKRFNDEFSYESRVSMADGLRETFEDLKNGKS